MIDANTVEPMTDPDGGFWSQRDELQHVLDFAQSRRVAPYAVLGCVLRRAVACVEPNVVLPATVGDVASVNLFTCSVGRSGGGKGASDAAGFAAVRFLGLDGEVIKTERPNPGSGEGLARLFKGRNDKDGDASTALTRAHLNVPEVSTLAALADRQGATLEAELLKGFSGEPLGFNNAHKETTTAIEAHSYRLCMGVGVQPENAQFFLSREKNGLPQRFLWLPTNDPNAPKVQPPAVEPIDVIVPDFGTERFIVGIPERARREIDAHRYSVLTGAEGIDPLDGHLMLTQLKVAFALAVLSGRKDIDTDDWTIAHELIEVSKTVRTDIRQAVDAKYRRENQAKALAAADREAIIAEKLTESTQERVSKAITRKLSRVGKATRHQLRQACAAAIRDDFDPVFELFIDTGFLVSCKGGDTDASEYQLAA
ncbi:Uncharacterised protein [Mycobacteroides abscessus subsp. massiliense]|nr:Uncharacterised protein [Mycobacteroides abscessus subsp. massiliense]SLI83988.1 Uncharacterised protein [Mycobacteroides abscessus subsp. massiliense]